uniref:Uncharacterized protein n=1 Tax=Ixodes ricinus TaxID=34613 RepID=A0A147BSP5_IXORI
MAAAARLALVAARTAQLHLHNVRSSPVQPHAPVAAVTAPGGVHQQLRPALLARSQGVATHRQVQVTPGPPHVQGQVAQLVQGVTSQRPPAPALGQPLGPRAGLLPGRPARTQQHGARTLPGTGEAVAGGVPRLGHGGLPRGGRLLVHKAAELVLVRLGSLVVELAHQVAQGALLPGTQAGQLLFPALRALDIGTSLEAEQQPSGVRAGLHAGGRLAALTMALAVLEGEGPFEGAGHGGAPQPEQRVEQGVPRELPAHRLVSAVRRAEGRLFVLQHVGVFGTYPDALQAVGVRDFDEELVVVGLPAGPLGGDVGAPNPDRLRLALLEPVTAPLGWELTLPAAAADDERQSDAAAEQRRQRRPPSRRRIGGRTANTPFTTALHDAVRAVGARRFGARRFGARRFRAACRAPAPLLGPPRRRREALFGPRTASIAHSADSPLQGSLPGGPLKTDGPVPLTMDDRRLRLVPPIARRCIRTRSSQSSSLRKHGWHGHGSTDHSLEAQRYGLQHGRTGTPQTTTKNNSRVMRISIAI